MDKVFDIIKQKLNERDGSWINVKGFMDYGVAETEIKMLNLQLFVNDF